MKCVFCGGTTKPAKVTFTYDEDNKYLFVENVPAELCGNCGEKTYSPEVSDELLKYTKKELKPVKMINVPLYDFTEHAK
jgi:HTH-type transcriptional regulator/antitoxin MqsA